MRTSLSLVESPEQRPSVIQSRSPRPSPWPRRYALWVTITDAMVVATVTFGTQILWLGPHPVAVASSPFTYTTVSAGLSLAWMAALSLWGTRQGRVIGYGVAEYRLVLGASVQLFGLVAIVTYLTGADLSRGYFLLGLPLGSLALILGRLLCRSWLARRRRYGAMSARVVLVGSAEENARVSTELARQPSAGLHVVGVHTLDRAEFGSTWSEEQARLLRGRLDDLGADSVLVSGGAVLDAHDIRRIGWSLDPGRRHLIVAVNLTDVAGPRLHTRPVAGLPLVHIETPQYSLTQRVMKRAFDIVGAGSLVLLLAPIFATLAVLVRASGPGPILYRQERVGQGGNPFGMLKFRSMIDGADSRLQELLSAQGRDGTPLFKVENDPRITPVGRWLRKFSLDELPQLFNVLGGQMSLVGPRPQRDAEVQFYDDDAHRRLIVRPGMSGLWQVSGRSALAWDDAIRLDLFYVENWSLIGDIVILLRTFKAVLAPGGTAH
ncbi:sugar transferase [Microbacterium sp. VKM Ac-2923]|uniref:sugar transferase n=1 Tax=Microbacterium sp. VKM Ac-2923 TaxID=2929476 RepID=UPI001FB3B5DC|nr:sugar transferase [Microbacterium sp. VKM Ac-2923]MCJ1706411.1 sugar transferase [Microbacterium sp. VKM Ac-2923]